MLPETFLICALWCHRPYSILDMRAKGKVSACFAHLKKKHFSSSGVMEDKLPTEEALSFVRASSSSRKKRTIFSLTFKQFCHVLPVALLRWNALKIVGIAERSPQSCEAIRLSHRSGSILGHHWEWECIYILCASSIVMFVKHALLTLKTILAHKEKALKPDNTSGHLHCQVNSYFSWY